MCTSGMINSRAFSGRVRPQGPGDEDGSSSTVSHNSATRRFLQFLSKVQRQHIPARGETRSVGGGGGGGNDIHIFVFCPADYREIPASPKPGEMPWE